jgi:hypothetical protein
MKKISFLLLAGFIISAFVFTATSCNPNDTPTPIRDTVYIHVTDTASCNCVCTDSCFGAIACYPFDGNANDVSGNNFNGTVSGATLTTGHTGKANSAYYFNKNVNEKIELVNLS